MSGIKYGTITDAKAPTYIDITPFSVDVILYRRSSLVDHGPKSRDIRTIPLTTFPAKSQPCTTMPRRFM